MNETVKRKSGRSRAAFGKLAVFVLTVCLCMGGCRSVDELVTNEDMGQSGRGRRFP